MSRATLPSESDTCGATELSECKSCAEESVGKLWAGRRRLPLESQDAVSSTPLLKVVGGKLELIHDAGEAFKKGTNEQLYVDRLVNSLAPVIENTNLQNSKEINNSSEECVVLNSIITKPSDFNRMPKKESSSTKKRKFALVDSQAQTAQNENTNCDEASPCVEIQVPVGVRSGDKLALFDRANSPTTFAIVSEAACEGQLLTCQQPRDCKLLLLDGEGYQVGGSMMKQHAVRLKVHTDMCDDPLCKVFGCNTKTESFIFETIAPDSDDVNSYLDAVNTFSYNDLRKKRARRRACPWPAAKYKCNRPVH